MKKLINDPQNVVAEALLGIEAAHPDLNVDHQHKIIYRGDVSSQDFLAFYIKDGQVQAVAGMIRDREMAAAEELMRVGRMPSADQLKFEDLSLVEMLHSPESVRERALIV